MKNFVDKCFLVKYSSYTGIHRREEGEKMEKKL